MEENRELKFKLQELVDRSWRVPEVRARCQKFSAEGIPQKVLDRKDVLSNKDSILNRVRTRAEEYNFVAGNCARSTALAVMEEFGFGTMQIIQALSPFPGFGGTGWMCGGVSGGLIAIGLYLGSDDLQNHEAMAASMKAGKLFMTRFEEEIGAVTCRRIQENVIFGRFMDPGASQQNMEAFAQAHGFEKCSLLAGIGAGIASEIIIEHMR